MTSVLRSLLRTSSTYTKADACNDPGNPIVPTTPAPGSPTSTLTSSPSFNDFSLHVGQDGRLCAIHVVILVSGATSSHRASALGRVWAY